MFNIWKPDFLVLRQYRYGNKSSYVGKYVRSEHVQTDEHWMSRPVEPNGVTNADQPESGNSMLYGEAKADEQNLGNAK